jgi:hypothetical protein
MKNKLLLLAMGIALSAQTLMAQVPSYVPTDGLVGYWPFSGNPNDASVNGNNGTNDGATLTADRYGNANSAYNFDGTSNYITINLINALNTANVNGLTLSGWTNMTSLSTQPQSILFMVDNLDNGFNTGYDHTSTKLYGQAGNAGVGAPMSISSLNTVSSNNWYNVVLTCDFNTNTSKLYINGVLQSQSSVTLITPVLTKIFIGRAYNQFWYQNGKLDDIGIWNRTLTEQEITNLYNANQCFNLITVTDTLIINVGQLSYNNPVTYANNITMAPNPASTQININFNNITDLNGGSLKVINSLGQEVATTPITTSGTQSIMQLATWGGSGMYYVQIINPQGIVVDVKKIILQ